jgi:hypothetical protein
MQTACSWLGCGDGIPSDSRHARRHHRSLAQQALSDLVAMAGDDPRHRRHDALVRLNNLWRQLPRVEWPESPETMLWADRER